ncbi:hypothetical protein IMX26_12995 [Clostridium sp. 'deep sea']|uniref:hypothetical protein n=1 Tax=Clostridium sp. 'deep sea' TaxID=2779445 RepID=UPI0018968A15|nr:hypothetical protein [Clostridium sp. 'deep sea']QOR34402.1 hypothetical protein IMX26_12995 [Clostridium sp. 'deep sea']
MKPLLRADYSVIEYFTQLLVHINNDFIKIILDLYEFMFNIPNYIFNNKYYQSIFWYFILLFCLLSITKFVFYKIHTPYNNIKKQYKQSLTIMLKKLVASCLLILIVTQHKALIKVGTAITDYLKTDINIIDINKFLLELNYQNLNKEFALEIGNELIVFILLVITMILSLYILINIIRRLVNLLILAVISPFVFLNILKGEGVSSTNYFRIFVYTLLNYFISLVASSLVIFFLQYCLIVLKLNIVVVVIVFNFSTVLVAYLLHNLNKQYFFDNKQLVLYVKTKMLECEQCI